LKDVSRAKIRDQLLEVGFDDARQAEIVGGLSGGWKMKLELARAMLYNADLLLLDEVITICRKNQINNADRNRTSSLPIMFVYCCLNAPELH
jgi:ABC-type branched-subunit amino acid transport system ATPase component